MWIFYIISNRERWHTKKHIMDIFIGYRLKGVERVAKRFHKWFSEEGHLTTLDDKSFWDKALKYPEPI